MRNSEKSNICQKCQRIHDKATSIAIGRFRLEGPVGYVARDVPGAPIRETRDLANADYFQHWCRSDDQQELFEV